MNGLASTTGNVTVTLTPGNYNIAKDSSGYDVINMDGFSDRVETGDPMLPHKTFDVLLPPDVDGSSLELKIISIDTKVLDGTYDIKPSPNWLPQTYNESASEIMKNESTYQTNADYPSNSALLMPTSQMRKWTFVPVDFIPFQYNPVTKKLTLQENVTIEISYSQKELPSAVVAGLLADRVLDDVAPTKFINYNQTSSWYVLKEEAKLDQSSVSDYVIVTTNAIKAGSSKLNSFIAHKQSLGYHVLVVTEDDFNGLTGQSPNNRAEKIRQWLKNNYISNSIKYVLLIGNPTPYESGEGDIPMKMCWPRRGASDGYQESPTDYFYADLTGDWDKNSNDYYGERADYTATGGLDLAADVYVGRIPVYGADYSTLDSVLQKIIDYDISIDAGWRKSTLLPMSFSDSSTDGAYLGEKMKNAYLSPNGYSYWRMYQHGTSGSCSLNSAFSSEENLRGGSVVPNRWAGSDYGIVTWWGHGNSQGAYVGYSSCSDGAFMLSSNAPGLDNNHPSHTYQCSCENGYPEDSSNLQYALLKNGAITTTSATRVSWYYVGQTSFATSPSNAGMGYEYVKLLVQGLPAGDALYGMKSTGVSGPGSSSEILMNFYDFCLYGDPSVGVNSFNPLPAVTNSNGATAIAANSARLNGEVTNTGIDNPEVHIYWGDDDAETSTTSWDHDENLGAMPSGTFYRDIAGLNPGTTYYYRCYASNSAGRSWASSTASFFTTDNSPPSVPSTPSGLTTGYTGTPYSYATSATDPGDKLKYTFNWGDGTTTTTDFVDSGQSVSSSHVWTSAGTYQIEAIATDSKDISSISWSSPLAVTIKANNPPTTPSKPSGSTTGYTTTAYSYSTKATDTNKDKIKYTFDWGDGTFFTTALLSSGTTASASHAWSNVGPYQVRAMATDSKDGSSSWSSPLSVTIITNSPPNTPAIPSGSTSGISRRSYKYTTSATDPDGDRLKYTFDWGDGKTSVTSLVNSGTSSGSSHAWSKAGTYQVKAMATDSKAASSSWSSPLAVTIA